MLPLLNPLGDFEHDGLQKASKYFKKTLVPVKFLVLTQSLVIELKSPNGCSNGGVSLLKVMLQWLTNCSIKNSLF